MPIYAFACAACGHHFDKLQKLSDPDPATCPACGVEGQVRRQLTAPSFRLSGSGWYETDFKKDGDRKRNLAGEGGEGAKTAEAGPSGKSDAKGEVAKSDVPAKPTAKPEPASKPDTKSEAKSKPAG
jgi:putative FmdB family regulatory protein